MPRPPRMDAPGAIHHVMIRGVERRAVFLNDDQRELFVERFERLVCDMGFACDALTLIANHVHAVIQTGDRPLAALMHRLNFFYAQHFNRQTTRCGHLFEARYKAKLVSDEGGLVRVVAYATGNPVRHRLTTLEALPDDPWSPLSALYGTRRPRRFESVSRLRALLGGAAARETLRAAALAPAAADAALEPDLLAELEYLIREMCIRHGVPRENLRCRANRAVRRELLQHAVCVLRVPVAHVGKALGVSRSCAQETLRRGHGE
jgi:REP element-mobilizing transposase RayT